MFFIFVLLFLYSAHTCGGQSTPEKTWTISGSVVSPEGPERDVWVRLSGGETFVNVKTDSSGNFEFKGKLSGTYSIGVNDKDHFSHLSPRTITVHSGEVVKGVDFRYVAGGALSGKVRMRDGKPVQRILVVALRRGFEDGQITLKEAGGAYSDETGQYSISGLAPGEYVAMASRLAGQPMRFVENKQDPSVARPGIEGLPPFTFAPKGTDFENASIVRILEHQEFSTLDIELSPTELYCASMEIRPPVDPPNGKNLKKSVSLRASWGPLSPLLALSQNTQASKLSICGLPAGSYLIHSYDYMDAPPKGVAFSHREFQLDKKSIELGSIVGKPTTSFEGKVVLSDSEKDKDLPAGILVALLRQNRSMFVGDKAGARVRPDGSFASPDVYAAQYKLELKNLPTGWYVSRMTQNLKDIAKSAFNPSDGPILIELGMDGGSVSGTVLSGTDLPVQDAVVLLERRSDQQIFVCQSDQRGNFSFKEGLPKGDYRALAINKLPDGLAGDREFARSRLQSGLEITVGPKESKSIKLIAKPYSPFQQ